MQAGPALDPAVDEGDATEHQFTRIGSGNQMPPEYRQNIVSSFLKLVAYDFGCNVSATRCEPRLYMTNPAVPTPSARAEVRKSSYFSSSCTFVFRTPRTREAARAGYVEGPLVAVSARHSVSFPPSEDSGVADSEAVVDLARELIAAIITAQHRARQGKAEKRIGEGEWWTTRPRWGGGTGGPIGREVEAMSGGTEEAVVQQDKGLPTESPTSSGGASSSRPSARPMPLGTGVAASKGPKRQKKDGPLPIYDNYRMVRPPAATWDHKTRYEAIGRRHGADFDDIFLVSALFHHISILRVRVPDRLLHVLEGAVDEPSASGHPSWGSLEVWRTCWYDLFKPEDRVTALQFVWSMMAFLMRQNEAEEQSASKDVDMPDFECRS